jgi:hypothetical protein
MRIFAYLFATAIGYALGHYLLDGPAAAYASLLVSYHLFLGFLVFSAEHKKGFSMPILQTIGTHSAVLALLIGLAYMRAQVPLFGLISLLVPGLAPFETQWLFSGDGKVYEDNEKDEVAPMHTASPEDQEAFRDYLMEKDRPFRRPGLTLSQEFNLWNKDRAQKKIQASAQDDNARATSAMKGARF